MNKYWLLYQGLPNAPDIGGVQLIPYASNCLKSLTYTLMNKLKQAFDGVSEPNEKEQF